MHNVVIHMAYSNMAYLCSVFSLLYLLPISLCDWSSLPAVSTSAQSVACFYVHHFRTTTGIHVMSGDWSSLYCHRLCAVMRIFWMCLNFWLKKLRVGWFSFVPAFTCSIAHDNNRSPLFFNQKLTQIQNLRIYSAISVMSIYTQSFMVKITTSSAAHECWFYINFLQLKIKELSNTYSLPSL